MKKKQYLAPETDVLSMVMGSTFICASADNLTVNSDYKDTYSEDEFWD